MIEPKKNTREYGLYQERRIIDALRRQNMTEFQLAEMFGVVRNTITVYMTRLRREKRIHIASFIRNPSGRPLPVFAPGNIPDAEYVVARYRSKERQPDRIQSARDKLLALLDKPHTAMQLCEMMNLTASPVRARLRELRAEKLIRVAGWRRAGSRNAWAPAYKLGSAPDTPKPKPLNNVQYHARRRSDPEKLRQEQQVRRLRDSIRKLRDKPASPFAALGV